MKGEGMKKILFFIIILSFFLVNANAYALDGIEVLSGYMNASLDKKDDYAGIPLQIALYFDAKPVFSKIGVEPTGRLDFIVEPFVTTIYSPNPNVEIGSNFLIKYVFPLSELFQPYLKGGLGMLYMSQHTLEQSTQYNFLPQVGAGFHIFFNKNTALSAEYRFRHLSNNSFRSPNRGIDANMFLGGLTFFFD